MSWSISRCASSGFVHDFSLSHSVLDNSVTLRITGSFLGSRSTAGHIQNPHQEPGNCINCIIKEIVFPTGFKLQWLDSHCLPSLYALGGHGLLIEPGPTTWLRPARNPKRIGTSNCTYWQGRKKLWARKQTKNQHEPTKQTNRQTRKLANKQSKAS